MRDGSTETISLTMVGAGRRQGALGRPATIAVAALAVLAGCTAQIPTAVPSGTVSQSKDPTSDAPACPNLPNPAAAQGPWWHDRVFYELFVRSFADADGDGIGDLDGLGARLDYLNDGDPSTTDDLGVTAIWLMPVFDSGSYHGYDVLDYEHIERDYGSLESFQRFIDGAHRRGIRVIVDLVINHTSADHPWFLDALAGGSRRDWYRWADRDPGWPGVTGGSPWHRSESGWYYGAFGAGMPDLNLANPAVTAELARIALTWLDRGVDGFRLDAAKHLIETGPETQLNTPETRAWLSAFRTALHAAHPTALVLGEVWEPRVLTSGYVADESLDMAFDFGIGPAAMSGARLGDATTLTVGLEEIAERYPDGGAAAFLTNHDQPRVMSVLRGDVSAAALAAEALLTGPGVPFVYYGEELGMLGTKPDEQIRTPLPWTAAGPGHGFTAGIPWEPFAPGSDLANVATEAADPGSLLTRYRDLVRLRVALPALATGTVDRIEVARPDVAVTLRWQADRGALVLQNLGDRAFDEPSLSLATGPLCGRPTARVAYSSELDSGQGAVDPIVTLSGGFAAYVPLPVLPPRSTTVIELNP